MLKVYRFQINSQPIRRAFFCLEAIDQDIPRVIVKTHKNPLSIGSQVSNLPNEIRP